MGSGRCPRVWWRDLQRQTGDSFPVSSFSNLLCDFGQITSLLWASASSFIKWVCWITWSQRPQPLPTSRPMILGTLPMLHCAFHLVAVTLPRTWLKLIHTMLLIIRFCPFLSGKCLFSFPFFFSLPPHSAGSQYTCQDDCLTLLPSALPVLNPDPVLIPRLNPSFPSHLIPCSESHLP